MKALVQYEKAPHKVKLCNTDIPKPDFDQVCIRVAYAGICGTDLHIYEDDGGYPTAPPVILGHELSGVVCEVGDDKDSDLIGKFVVSETYYYTCGDCYYCRSGHHNLCSQRTSIGSGVNGAMAEYVVVPKKNIHVLPAGISLQEAALTEPLACCVQAVLEHGKLKPQDQVLITGPGAIGLMCLQIAVLSGAKVILAGIEKDQERLQLGKKLGAYDILYSDAKDYQEKLLSAFPPYGPDVAFECSGSEKAINMCLQSLRKGGRYVQVGLTGRPTTLDMNLITLKEINISGTFAQKSIWWDRSIDFIHHKLVTLSPLISDIYPLEQWEEAFMKYKKGEGLKYLLSCTDGN